MDSETRKIIHAVWAFTLVLVVLIVTTFAYNAYSWHEIREGEYIQTAVPGCSEPVWTKK